MDEQARREREADRQLAEIARERKEAVDLGEMGTTSLEDMIAEFGGDADAPAPKPEADAEEG